MSILAIDTSLQACSVAASPMQGGDDAIAFKSHRIGVGHAEHLAPMVQSVLAEVQLKASDVKRILVTVGPGSFMGVRVGISFAKGLAMAHGALSIPITTLDALWLNAPMNADGFALIDAKRGQVYVQGFGAVAAEGRLLDYETARSLVMGEGLTLIGSGVAAILPTHQKLEPPENSKDGHELHVPDVKKLVREARRRDPAALLPSYLRAPDAAPAKAAQKQA
ncbi:MAG: tRNA (adenosine(37)-N6)-threonylcarbamoyltransferase complex dimerization subunit type 1 TsaB [Pseudomonadota bacterium]